MNTSSPRSCCRHDAPADAAGPRGSQRTQQALRSETMDVTGSMGSGIVGARRRAGLRGSGRGSRRGALRRWARGAALRARARPRRGAARRGRRDHGAPSPRARRRRARRGRGRARARARDRDVAPGGRPCLHRAAPGASTASRSTAASSRWSCAPTFSLVALSGAPTAAASPAPAQRTFLLSPGEALAEALGTSMAWTSRRVLDARRAAQDSRRAGCASPNRTEVRLSEPARAKPVYYPAGDQLVAAYFVEFFSSAQARATTSDAYRYLVAADDGRVLERHNLTADDAFNYRVWAEPHRRRRPLDGPIADFTPHPTGAARRQRPAVRRARAGLDGVVQDATPRAPSIPGSPAGAVADPGNNVDAYADLLAAGRLSNGDLRATTTAPGTFDRVYDIGARAPAPRPADHGRDHPALLHDQLAARLLVRLRLRRGGGQRPARQLRPRRHSAATRSAPRPRTSRGLNNANMSRPADGVSPRMQMYLWSAAGEERASPVEPGGVRARPRHRRVRSADRSTLTGRARALAVDGAAAHRRRLRGRSPTTSPARSRSSTAAPAPSRVKALAAEARRRRRRHHRQQRRPARRPALGNEQPAAGRRTSPRSASASPTATPSRPCCWAKGPVTAAHVPPKPAGPGRDGTLDNTIVAHEWGHYFHHRLADCSTLAVRRA